MKLKIFALSIAMVACAFTANAQATYKGNDVFVGVGAGIVSPLTPGFNTPAFYGNLMVGKYITPVWGVRGVIGGPFESLNANNGNAYMKDGSIKAYPNKLFGEFNADGILNISNIFADDLAKLDFYLFAGPTLNLSSVGTKFSSVQDATVLLVEENNDLKVRVGASAGLGLAYNFTNTFALGVEGRFGVTPSIFGDADKYRKAEGTTRFALNGIWTIGGKHGKIALAAAAVAKNPKIVEKVVTKEVEKQVEKLVNNEVPSSTAVFFQIGKSTLTPADKARIQLFADSAKSADATYEVAGYADKKTGSAKKNMAISEKRATAVYDALVAAGVPASKLEKKAYGGVDPIFFNNDVLSRTVIVKKK